MVVALRSPTTVATPRCSSFRLPATAERIRVANEIAPENRRAEVASRYFVCGFVGNLLTCYGVGVTSTPASSTTASLVFALTMSVWALVALLFGIKYRQ
jgi:hypothetical protein